MVAAAGATAATSLGAPNKPKDKVQAKIRQGTLTVTGTSRDDTLALALSPGDPSTLELLVDGAPQDDFKLAQIDQIVVDGAKGDDTISIDESNGAFTTTIPTTLAGGDGNDTLRGGSGARDPRRR